MAIKNLSKGMMPVASTVEIKVRANTILKPDMKGRGVRHMPGGFRAKVKGDASLQKGAW
jgi:hypothetical protein